MRKNRSTTKATTEGARGDPEYLHQYQMPRVAALIAAEEQALLTAIKNGNEAVDSLCTAIWPEIGRRIDGAGSVSRLVADVKHLARI